MSGIDEAIAALQAGAYQQADEILVGLGADKPGAAVRARAFWAITQVLRLNFNEEAVDAVLEVARRAPNRTDPIYDKVVLITGPLDEVLPPEGAQEVRLRIGDYFLREEKAEEATPWLEAALAAAPADPIAIYLEANCRFALYGERQAVRDMEGVLHRAAADTYRAYYVGGQTAGFWYRLGLIHERLKNLEEAAEYLAEAVALDPDQETPRILLGDILIRLGRFDEAISLLEPIPQYADGYRYAARLRAVALYRIGRVEEALALLQEVAEIDPLGAINFLEMGRIYLARGEIELAETALARAFRTNPELSGLRAAIVALERELDRHMDPDAGLPLATEFAIPEEFAAQPDDPALAERADFKSAWTNYVRVMRALIVRDILALYAHSGMGYLWALAQPLAYIATLWAVFMLAGRSAPLGTSIVAYLAAGIVPFVSFYVRIEVSVSSAVRSNVNLLYFRQVTPFVLITAAFLREYLTSMFVFIVITAAIAMYDPAVEIHDPLLILAAVTCMSLIAAIVGTLFGLGQLAMPSLLLAETVLSRVMFFFSGALYYANLIPKQMREWALLNPLLHLIEFVRDGFFTIYQSRYANWHYPLEFIAVGLALVMVLLYSTRRYVVAQ
jgi:capsular polysaccharide transport system permease protein